MEPEACAAAATAAGAAGPTGPDPGALVPASPRKVYDAGKLAEQAPRRADWASARLAVMTILLRAKYTQHPQMAQTLLASGDAHVIAQDDEVSTATPGTNLEYDTTILRYAYTSLVTPQSIYDYELDTRERTLLKQEPVLGGYDPEQYETRRLWATASSQRRAKTPSTTRSTRSKTSSYVWKEPGGT